MTLPQDLRAPIFLMMCLLFPNLSKAQLENLGKSINTEYNEIGPTISPDGKTLYFSRVSHPQNTNTTKGGQDIWYSELRNDVWTPARRLGSPLNREEYNSLYSITPDGNTLLLKGAYKNGVYETRGFSISKKNARGWSAPNKLEIPGYTKLSKGQFDCGFLSNDGKVLVMSFSEKKGSKVDNLYVSFKQKDGSWTKPQDLGPEINLAEFTETTPFLAPDGVTLYFSSDRKGGQGSNDIYYSKRIDKSWKRWSRPVNLGSSINTDGYDAYYSISALGDYAYMVSFKDTQGKGDIVRYDLRPKPTEGDSTVSPTIAVVPATDPVALISGKVIDSKTGKPVEATVIYEDLESGEEVGTATTNPSTGEYKIVLPKGKHYSMRAIAPNFIAEGENIDLTNATDDGKSKQFTNVDNKLLKLIPIEEGQIVRLNNIFFATGKSTLAPESDAEINRIAITMVENKNMKIELGGHTDDIGTDEANMKLSQERADNVRTSLLKKGVEANRIISKGYGETVPIAKNDTPEGQQLNRRVEFKILKK